MATHCLSWCLLEMYTIYFSLLTFTYIQYACVYVCKIDAYSIIVNFNTVVGFLTYLIFSFCCPALPCFKYGLCVRLL